jgi:hypothetical protein
MPFKPATLEFSGVSGETGEVMALSDAQVWTVIGLFAAGMSALIAMTLRVVSVEISALRVEMTARLDHMDRDIQALMKHVFGER